MNFKGVGVALVTPFTKDNKIDFPALKNLIDFDIQGGVDFLVTMGTTGETPTLDTSEKKELLEQTRSFIDSRVPLVMGIGGNDTRSVVAEIAQYTTDHVDAVLTVCPYYNKPNQKGLFAHFDAIAQESKVPLILYNVPGRTSSNILPDTVLELAHKHENIIAIKEASGNLAQIMQIIQNKPSHFHVLSGDDDLVLPEMAMGVEGVISVVANAFPQEFSEMVHQAQNGDFDKAKILHYQLVSMIWMLFEEGNPAGVKYVLHRRSITNPDVRLPLVGISDNLSKKMDAEIAKLF